MRCDGAVAWLVRRRAVVFAAGAAAAFTCTACTAPEHPRKPTGLIAFSSGSARGESFADVFVVDPGGSRRLRLTRRPGPEFDPSWSPDGRRLVYRDSRRGINKDDEIFVMNANGTRMRNISRSSSNDWSPAWAPDGAWIAFASERRGALDIWLMRPSGADQRPLTRRGRDEYPTWSPDSKWIAFMRLGDIWIVHMDGSDEHPLTETVDEEGWPAWSPDGKRIAFIVGYEGARTVWVMDRDGSHRRRLTSPGHDDMGVCWSPDGQFLAFSRNGALTVMRSDGTDLREIGVSGYLPDWHRAPG
jgi:TolB protein